MAVAPELVPSAREPLKPVTINGRVFEPQRYPSGMVYWGAFQSFEEAAKYPITKPQLDLHALVEKAIQKPSSLLPWERYIDIFVSENAKRLTKVAQNSNRPQVSPHEVVDRLLNGGALEQVEVGWFVNRMGTRVEVEDVEIAARRANKELASIDLISGYGIEGIDIVPTSVFTAENSPYIPFPQQREYELNELSTKPKLRLWERIILRTMEGRTPDPQKTMVKFTGRYDPYVFETQLWLANGYLADRKQMMWVSDRGIERGPLHTFH